MFVWTPDSSGQSRTQREIHANILRSYRERVRALEHEDSTEAAAAEVVMNWWLDQLSAPSDQAEEADGEDPLLRGTVPR